MELRRPRRRATCSRAGRRRRPRCAAGVLRGRVAGAGLTRPRLGAQLALHRARRRRPGRRPRGRRPAPSRGRRAGRAGSRSSARRRAGRARGRPPAGDEVADLVALGAVGRDRRQVVERVVEGEAVGRRVVDAAQFSEPPARAGQLGGRARCVPPAWRRRRPPATRRGRRPCRCRPRAPSRARRARPRRSGTSRRSTTQRSGSAGRPSRFVAPAGCRPGVPRSSASGIAQCRCTPGARGGPSSRTAVRRRGGPGRRARSGRAGMRTRRLGVAGGDDERLHVDGHEHAALAEQGRVPAPDRGERRGRCATSARPARRRHRLGHGSRDRSGLIASTSCEAVVSWATLCRSRRKHVGRRRAALPPGCDGSPNTWR